MICTKSFIIFDKFIYIQLFNDVTVDLAFMQFILRFGAKLRKICDLAKAKFRRFLASESGIL